MGQIRILSEAEVKELQRFVRKGIAKSMAIETFDGPHGDDSGFVTGYYGLDRAYPLFQQVLFFKDRFQFIAKSTAWTADYGDLVNVDVPAPAEMPLSIMWDSRYWMVDPVRLTFADGTSRDLLVGISPERLRQAYFWCSLLQLIQSGVSPHRKA